MPRPADEISADAAVMAAAAEAQMALAVKLRDLQNIAPAATAAAETAAERANQARQAAAAGDIASAETYLDTAKAALAHAVSTTSPAAVAAGLGELKDEWKECRATIDRFDKLLVDLRKTGFGVVTALVGASTFVFSSTAGTKAAMMCMLVLLIVTLYLIDLTHQIWLAETVSHARELEARLHFRLTRRISGGFQGSDATILGFFLYVALLIVTFAIFWVAIPATEHITGGHRITMMSGLAVGLVAMVAAMFWKRFSAGVTRFIARVEQHPLVVAGVLVVIGLVLLWLLD
jgi:hypothetical protein